MEPLDELELAERARKFELARKRARRARIMALVALVVTVATCAYLYYTDLYQGIPLDRHPTDQGEVEALATGRWKLESIEVPGATLRGLVRPPRRKPGDWIVYFGGNADHSLRSARAYASLLLRPSDDYGWASFAYRGFDTSSGQATPGTFQADARATFDHLVDRHELTAKRLHIIGFSLGANAAALLGQDLARDGQSPASTTLMSPGMAPHSLPAWLFPLVLGAWEMRSKLETMPGPVLLISASDDAAYPPNVHARKMPPLLGKRLSKHLEVQGGHDAPLQDPESLEAVREFVTSRQVTP